MKFVALVSGGKDSIYSILECQRNGHELVACVHLGAPECEEEESYMYQTAASEVLPVLVEECLGVPLILYRRVGKSVNTSLVYEETSQADEVEDLYKAVESAVHQFPQVTAVCSGAILSTYQRVRIENVCSRLGLTSLSYLWRMATQQELLARMLEDEIEAVLVKTACPPGLMPSRHLNKTLGQLYYSGLFQKLHEKYQFHMCGEGGEFETIVLDCPLYRKRLVLDDVEIVETEDGVGVLIIKSCHAEEKETVEEILRIQNEALEHETDEAQPAAALLMNSSQRIHASLPRVQRSSGGLFHLSEIMCPIAAAAHSGASEADLAVEEALAVFDTLETALAQQGATAQDVVFVHLYLSEISHFTNINAHYSKFFGTLLPPSRSCVAVGKRVLPGGRRVLMDCMVQCGSGSYMRQSSVRDEDAYANVARSTTTSSLREVLHVQSISYWAPVCVGPYSQANTLRSGLCFLAGQIGLIPSTMKLHTPWTRQLEQCWTNVASVLDATDSGSLKNMVSGLVYVSDSAYAQGNAWDTVESISQKQFAQNGGVSPGLIDSTGTSAEDFGGYEDEETWREVTGHFETCESSVPLLFVCIPEMPVGALVELEVICATQKAASCLDMQTTYNVTKPEPVQEEYHEEWDTGYDFSLPKSSSCDEIEINVASRSIGYGCAAMSVVTAKSLNPDTSEALSDRVWIDPEDILHQMLDVFEKFVLTSSSGLAVKHVLHIRLFYVSSSLKANGDAHHVKAQDDGTTLRCALYSVLSSRWGNLRTKRRVPACTVVPVQVMKLVQISSSESRSTTADGDEFLAMQVLVVDPVHMETELWIHHGREEN